jgi:hypothetical protein
LAAPDGGQGIGAGGVTAGAQASVALATSAQMVPPQQVGLAESQLDPAGAQVGPVGVTLIGAQTRAPGGPTQLSPLPSGQSSFAEHGAPVGTLELRQERTPVASGRQRPPQHWLSTSQG